MRKCVAPVVGFGKQLQKRCKATAVSAEICTAAPKRSGSPGRDSRGAATAAQGAANSSVTGGLVSGGRPRNHGGLVDTKMRFAQLSRTGGSVATEHDSSFSHFPFPLVAPTSGEIGTDAAGQAFGDEVQAHWQQVPSPSGFPNVNARYRPDEHITPRHTPNREPAPGASEHHWDEEWASGDLQSATEKHVMLSWGPSGPAKDLPRIVRGKGVYLYDEEGNDYLDWTSQAVCSNFGHDVPQTVLDAVTKQMESVAYVYSGLGMVPLRSRLSQLMAEITPGDISGFLFPCTGAEANEAAVRIARRYTGRRKILTQYRSYHGGTAQTLGATGDFRRYFTEADVSGFVKMFNPQPAGFSWGKTDEEASTFALQVLEEQILFEGPDSIAAIMLESIVGAGGVLVPPCGYMEGIRALCDRYGILLILDEVMAGFGRTGQFWAFEHFDGVIPDIFTSAKGLTGAYLPLSMVAVRDPIRRWFLDQPVGWGSTYHAHPTSLACAYECVKHTIDQQLCARVRSHELVMLEEIQRLIETHISVKQGRAIGLFGCIDLQGADGRAFNKLGANPPFLQPFRKALKENGLITLFRPPLLHCCPPLTITESELRDGFRRLSKALHVLDEAVVDMARK